MTKHLRRAALVGALVLTATSVAAEESVPTAQNDATWPTALQLREQLREAGWVWGATAIVWDGGPPDAAMPQVTMMSDVGWLVVSVRLDSSDVDLLWPTSVQSSWTAASELMDRLPVDLESRMKVAQWASDDEAGCSVLPLPGGSVLVDRPNADNPRMVLITFQQDDRLACND